MSAPADVAKAASVPERVGTYRVVAHFDFLGTGERIVLLAKSSGMGLDYATGVVSVFEDAPREWSSSRHFDGLSPSTNLRSATRNFFDRVTTRITAAG
ncbi:hypothetical protein [Umezawaea sp. Da 62-37]|uniref:hypothetical protein n=1 Tax=Umezawaea sp. Da 62-37 TaxID=3075927 RepID=UPI0028F6C29D|nr:hypothetical protein [Umezawaea sp. Da 62-37]WNV90284.1 hypothetical protein RM788_18965 [Umezawaea sp. Da 62-37]